MNIIADASKGHLHFPCVSCSLLLLFVSTPALMRADVTNLTGTVTSNESISHYGASFSTNVQLQGTNFTLTGILNTDAFLSITGNPLVATVNPTNTRSFSAPLVFGGPGGFNSLQLVYNGSTYTNIQLALSFAGAPATVPNIYPVDSTFTGGNVSSVPFTMTGTVDVYATSPPFSGSPLFSVSISGAGNYSGGGTLALPSSGTFGVTGASTYQFAPGTAFTTDSTTQGAWTGKYGGEGYWIANGPSYQPSYAAVNVSQASTYTWTGQTTDPRALQNGLGATSNIASAFTANSFNFNVAFTDGNPHRVSLYLLDWDTTSRNETVTITDNTGAVLDTESLSNFQNGVWASWNLQGSVTIKVSRTGGANAVVSGIFFGSPGTILPTAPVTTTSSAVYGGMDTTSQGAWPIPFGTNAAYMIANGPNNPPSYAAANVSGASTYTWAGQTPDPRALLFTPSSTTGIASAYTQYPSQSFSININIADNGLHKIGLYLLDWDNEGRAETVTVRDLSTNAVLDTRTYSAFQGGLYAIWYVTGNVVITVTPAPGSTPVVSGIFFN